MKAKKIVVLIMFILLLIPSTAIAISDTRTVYVTETGSKYHAYGCDYINNRPYKTTVTTAENKGYSPCKVCDPYGLATDFYGLETNEYEDNYSYSSDFDIESLVTLLLSAFLFMSIPIIVKVKQLMFDNISQVRQFVIANSVVVSLGYVIFISITGSGFWYYIFFPIVYGILNYLLLRNSI